VFARKNEFSQIRVAFLADTDMWRFTAVPECYSDVTFTVGYSIENDVYADSQIDDLLSPTERLHFQVLINQLIRWFAFEVEEYRATSTCNVGAKLSRIIPAGTTSLCPIFIARRGFREPHSDTIAEITKSWKLSIRGKTLEDAWFRLLGDQSRNPHHSRTALLELFIKINPSEHVQRLIRELRKKFAVNETLSLTS